MIMITLGSIPASIKSAVVGVSGGADSLCLLDLLRRAGQIKLTVAHFNHKLRPEADTEVDFVKNIAFNWGLPFVTGAADVRALSTRESLSIEEAARRLRYQFLFEIARKNGAEAVAVAHNADDQVETVLMHFLRGAGLPGLRGMQSGVILDEFDTKILVVRPLLRVWRDEIEIYCQERNLLPLIDPTNSDQSYFRNRLRHALIPELERYNPKFKNSMLRMAQVIGDDSIVLQETVNAAWRESVLEAGDDYVIYHRHKLTGLANALQRHLIRAGGELLRPKSRDFSFNAVERLVQFLAKPTGRRVDFVRGLALYVESDKAYLAKYESDLPFSEWPQIARPLLITDGSYDLGNGWTLVASQSSQNIQIETTAPEKFLPGTDNWTVFLDADQLTGTLTVRSRLPNDRFIPLGMNGKSVRLKDFLVNVKLPARARQHWPLICNGDEIAWIPGYRIANPFRLSDKTRKVLCLSVVQTQAAASTNHPES